MKKWYESKMIWVGVLVTIQGAIPLVVDFLNQGVFSTPAFLVMTSGIITVLLRVWTNDPIQPIEK